jgi:general secretion pathway protein D
MDVKQSASAGGRIGAWRFAASLPAFAVAVACQSSPTLKMGTAQPSSLPDNRSAAERVLDQRRTSIQRIPGPQAERSVSGVVDDGPESASRISTLFDTDTVRATLPPQPVAQFVDTVFNEILKVPYSLGPGVSEMRNIVALRGAVEVDERTFFGMIEMALRDYGLSVSIENGVVRVAKNDSLMADAPLIVRSRSTVETPEASRPVIQFFELQSVDASTIKALLDETFPDLGGVRITARPDINTLVIVGRAREVTAAAQIVSDIDQPRLAGAQIARIEPVFWAADRLAASLTLALQTEGYQANASSSGSISRAVNFMPVPFTNQLLVFSSVPAAFERALFWVSELDKPSALGDQTQVFVYQVRNTSAEQLGAIAASVSGEAANVVGVTNASGSGGGQGEGAPPSQQRAQVNPGPAALPGSGGMRITVDSGGNRLLYRGTPSEFERARRLFEQLDVPPLQVFIEITIAEVTLSDETRFGLEWFAEEALNTGLISGGTLGGLGLSGGGLSIEYDHGTVKAALNAFASNNNINVLSSPRIVARSGGEARIQVGTDVPIITSQRASNSQVGGNTDVLQSVQYRQTGVILTVKPVVFGDSVELEVFQEVSSQADNPNAAIGSPLILNRSLETSLTVREGTTAVIGGLMQDNYTRGNTGVPFLKDIPLIGSVFRTDRVSGGKTELLMLVTPRIIRSGQELEDAANFYSDSLNAMLYKRGPTAYTLTPWRNPWSQPERSGIPTPTEIFERSAPLEPTSPDPAAAPLDSSAPAAQQSGLNQTEMSPPTATVALVPGLETSPVISPSGPDSTVQP